MSLSGPTSNPSQNPEEDLDSTLILDHRTPDSPQEQDQYDYTSTMGPSKSMKGRGGYNTATASTTGNGNGNGNANALNETDDGTKDHGAPGSSWNNKKANEEYERAMAGLSDKTFSMAKYKELIEVPKTKK